MLNHGLRCFWLALMGSLGAAISVSAQTGAVSPVHDPTVIQTDSGFYLYSTGTGIPSFHSTNLYDWQASGRVFTQIPAWIFQELPAFKGGHLWAPDISYHNGLYLLYYCASIFGKNDSCIALAVNKSLDPASPAYRWEDRGLILKSRRGQDNWNAIDPQGITDESGRRWLVFGSYWSGIQMTALNPDTGKPLRQPPELIHLASRKDSTAIEAPFIVRQGGFYYLFVSFDQCCKGIESTYHLLVGRSPAITGPYVDFTGKPMLQGGATLVLDSYGSVHGPGHNSVVQSSGRHWLVHHFYDGNNQGARTLQIRPLYWLRNGWPVAGEPIEGPLTPLPAKPATSVAGIWDFSVNFAPAQRLELQPQGKALAETKPGSWSLNGNWLTLRWPDAAAPQGAWVDECVLAPNGQYFVGRNQSGVVIRATVSARRAK